MWIGFCHNQPVFFCRVVFLAILGHFLAKSEMYSRSGNSASIADWRYFIIIIDLQDIVILTVRPQYYSCLNIRTGYKPLNYHVISRNITILGTYPQNC